MSFCQTRMVNPENKWKKWIQTTTRLTNQLFNHVFLCLATNFTNTISEMFASSTNREVFEIFLNKGNNESKFSKSQDWQKIYSHLVGNYEGLEILELPPQIAQQITKFALTLLIFMLLHMVSRYSNKDIENLSSMHIYKFCT